MVRLLLLVLSFLTVTSCATSDGSQGDAASNDGDIYYKTQAAADRALEAFDTANPSCQLWTNWQKMCSHAPVRMARLGAQLILIGQ